MRSYAYAAGCLLTLLFSATAAAAESPAEAQCETSQFTFSWPFRDGCELQPRGGTSRGAELTLDPGVHPGWESLQEDELSDFERDRRAILAMAGPYRTSFDFIEIVGYQPGFEPDRPYQSWGTEYVYVVEDSGDFISLQHIMVMYYEDDDGEVEGPVVQKHWRQDWQYQKREIFQFMGDGHFASRDYDAGEVEGHWSQAVYQVDDSPRYEAIGEWEHKPNFSTWRSDETWRPLPRRESSVREDYDVLIGTNRHTIVPDGWVQEEANHKVVLTEPGELREEAPYLSKELGVNRYQRLEDFDFSAGDRYWEATAPFWADVREAWDRIIAENDAFTVRERVDEVPLFAPFFEYAEQIRETGDYDPDEGRQFIDETLERYVEK